jgi:hypothetical protein
LGVEQMIIHWHGAKQTVMNRSFIGHVRTGETRNVKNWHMALKIQRRESLWTEALDNVDLVASGGKDLVAGQPQTDYFDVEEKKLAVVYGVIQKGETPQGRVSGEYKFILCDADEVLTVLSLEFRIKQRLARR